MMKKTLLIALFAAAAACGGSKKPAAKPETTETTPVEKKGPSEEEQKAQAEADAKAKSDADAAAAQAALTEQYDAGKKVYTEKACVKCHGEHGEGNPKNPPVIGEKALPEAPPKTAKLRKGVTFKTAADVEAFVKAKMPLKGPGTLSDDEAFAVTAWMLSESKVALDKKLDAENAASVNLHAAQ
jgi:cytochrome c